MCCRPLSCWVCMKLCYIVQSCIHVCVRACVRACLRVCECLRVRKLINEWGKVSIVFLIRKGFSTHTCMSSIFFYNVLSSVLHD